MWNRSAVVLLLLAFTSCLLPALANNFSVADMPWWSDIDSLIKKLQLPALDKKLAPPDDLPRERDSDQGGAQDPATKRAVPINQYSDFTCGLQDIVLPTSTEDVAAAVRYYYGLVPTAYGPRRAYGPFSEDGNVKIRVASRIRGIPMTNQYREVQGMAERPGFSCPKGSTADTRTAVIATQDMNKVLHKQGHHVTVQAGITMTELIDYANANQLTLPLGTVPAYLDLTLGGLLAVGGHAQGPKGASNVADMVTHITFVDGTGRIHTVDRYCLEGRGLSGGLGMLGIITEVTLKLQEGLQKTKLWAIGPQADTNIEQELKDMIERYDGRLLVSWRPDLNLVKYRVWEEVPQSTDSVPPESPEVPTRAGPVKPQTEQFWVVAGAYFTAFALDAAEVQDKCAPFGAELVDRKLVFVGNDAETQHPLDNATALTNNMQGADCNRPASPTTGAPAAGSCFFDPRITQALNASGVPSFTLEESEFAVPLEDLPSVIADLRALSALGGPCWLPSFLQLRPGASTPDLIGPASGAPSDRFMWVLLVIIRPNLPGRYGTVPLPPSRAQKNLAGLQEGFEQLMVCKYGGRPLYGHMWTRVYASTACPIRDLFPQFHQQLRLQDKYDPAKLFETALLSTLIAGGNQDSQFPGCSNEMQCYCSGRDAECGVTATGVAYKCKTAPAPLPPFKVCMP